MQTRLQKRKTQEGVTIHGPSKSKNILVLNYDKTLFTIHGTHIHMLSKPLIDFVLSGGEHYDGFYVFTHRCVNLLSKLKINLDKQLAAKRHNHETSYEQSCLDDNFPTPTITQHFIDATGLHCHGISTPDDYWEGDIDHQSHHKVDETTLGMGYENKLKPWEMKGMQQKDKPEKVIPLKVLHNFHANDLEYRLTQIAKKVAREHPDHSITLTFINDIDKQCRKALIAPNSPTFRHEWPTNVVLDVYYHNAKSNHEKVYFVGSAKKSALALAPRTERALGDHTMFAGNTHQMLTRGKKQAQAAAAPTRHVKFG